MKQTQYGLVRSFECADSERPVEDETSAKLLYELFLALKVIRPTAGRFQVFHYDLSQTTPRLPRGSRNDHGTILCDCDRSNAIYWEDLLVLEQIGRSIADALRNAKLPIAQAIQNLEIGYRADFLNVRHLLWVVGLDALFTSAEWENQGTTLAVKRVTDFLGADFEIYSEASGALRLPRITLAETLRDVYKLRNQFAHGAWPEKQWTGRIDRKSVDYSREIYYAEVLSEAASAILRGCLKRILCDESLVVTFNEKAKMNAHFACRGLVRNRKNARRDSTPLPDGDDETNECNKRFDEALNSGESPVPIAQAVTDIESNEAHFRER